MRKSVPRNDMFCFVCKLQKMLWWAYVLMGQRIVVVVIKPRRGLSAQLGML